MPAKVQRRRSRPRGAASSLAARRAPKPWPAALRIFLALVAAVVLGGGAFLLYQRERRLLNQQRIEEQRFLDDFDRRVEAQERRARSRPR